jgi:hypothetical protein
MPAKIVARQIDLICAPKLMSAPAALAAPNGGSARAYLADSSRRQRSYHHEVPGPYLVTAV